MMRRLSRVHCTPINGEATVGSSRFFLYANKQKQQLRIIQPLRKAKRKCALFIAQLAGRIILRSKITRRARMNLRSKELTIKGATKRASSMRKIRMKQRHYATAQLAPRRARGGYEPRITKTSLKKSAHGSLPCALLYGFVFVKTSI